MVRQGGVALSAESNCSSSAAGVWLPRPPGTYRRPASLVAVRGVASGASVTVAGPYRLLTGFPFGSPDLLGEPNCRGTILAVKTLSPAGALHHRGLSCVFTILRPRRCRAPRWLGAPRAGSAPSSPGLHIHDSLSPRVPVGPGVVPPRRPVGHNVVRLCADGTILVSPDIGRSVERVEVRSVSTRATCHAG